MSRVSVTSHRRQVSASLISCGLLAVLPTAPAVAAQTKEVTLYTISGELVRGSEPVGFDERAGISMDVPGHPRRTFPLSEVVSLDLGSSSEGLEKTGDIVLYLRNGDSLRGAVEDGNADDLTVRSPVGPVKVTLNAIDRLIVASSLPRRDASEGFVPMENQDTVYKKTAKGTDVISGTLESFTKEGFLLDWGRGKYPFKFQEIVALALVPQGKVPELGRGAAFVAFRDGGRLTGPLRSIGGGFVELDWMYGKRLRVSIKHVASVTLAGDRYVFVSDLQPKQSIEVPAFGGDEAVLFPHRKDRSVGGGPLEIQGLRFAKGLGMHARSELVYALEGAYASFSSLIGIDDETRSFPVRGTAIFRVLVDGQKRFEQRVAAGASAERVPPIDVKGAKELRLVVDFADEVGAGARGDWGNAILLKP